MEAPRARRFDVIVIGAGLAGMSVALHAQGRSVLLLTKAALGRGGATPKAMGGVAVAVGADDSPQQHAYDTLAVGGGISDPEIVRLVTEEGPQRVRALMLLGARFDRDEGGGLSLGREAAHSRRRVVHAVGDATGAELMRALTEAVERAPRVQVASHHLAVDLVESGGRIAGVAAVDRIGQRHLYRAGAVVLATGGAGRLWRYTTNAPEVTGDGLALAARAGARMTGLEFVQFHPTALAVDGDPQPLLTEALRGEGATLIDERGRRFMEGIHPLMEMAPRDVVARAICRHALEGHAPALDARGIGPRLLERFPTVVELCAARGINPLREPVPVSPAAHYHMGGVMVDAQGRTSRAGLWACGEAAYTGLHGANRLASNSLLEALVFGARIGEALSRESGAPTGAPDRPIRWPDETPWLGDARRHHPLITELRARMWVNVGLTRCAAGLEEMTRWLARQDDDVEGEAGHMLLAARLITEAARLRTESRGAHLRTDFPLADPLWRRPLIFEGLQPLLVGEARMVMGS